MQFIRIVFGSLLLIHTLTAFSATPIPAPPSFKSGGYVLMDSTTGTIIAEKEADTQLEPASLTKIMTAYLAFKELGSGRIALEDTTIVSEKAWKTGGSRMFIEVNKTVSIDDLLHGLVIQSGNDAAVALAEHIAGSEAAFADLMNQEAKRLGMTGSHFVNATGWPAEGHVTTARDLATLARAMIHDFPELYKLNSIKEFEFNNIKQYNRNKLLWRDKTVDGVKTGHTEAAGYCLVASAMREDMRLISVVLGTASDSARASSSSKLLNYGFRFYETRELYTAGQELTKSRIWKAEKPEIRLGIKEGLTLLIPRGNYDLLKAELEFPQQIVAPVKAGDTIGEVIVNMDGKLVTKRPLIALEDITEAGFLTRMIDNIRLMIE